MTKRLLFTLAFVAMFAVAAWRGRGDGRLHGPETALPPLDAATATAPAPEATPTPCDLSYPNPYLPGTCAHATLESQFATWTAANCAGGEFVNGVLNCQVTAAPTWTRPAPGGYPGPGTPAYP